MLQQCGHFCSRCIHTVATLPFHRCYTDLITLLHVCCNFAALLLPCCYHFNTLLLHYSLTVLSPFLPCCYTVVALLLHCPVVALMAVTLLSHWLYTALTLLLHYCHTNVALKFLTMPSHNCHAFVNCYCAFCHTWGIIGLFFPSSRYYNTAVTPCLIYPCSVTLTLVSNFSEQVRNAYLSWSTGDS
jgi:hypothetical protein